MTDAHLHGDQWPDTAIVDWSPLIEGNGARFCAECDRIGLRERYARRKESAK